MSSEGHDSGDAASGGRPTDRSARVLVVDDNEAIADTYAAFLDDEYEVQTAYSGEAALDRIDPTVDVVLLDRRMPGIGGDEVLERIDATALDCRVVMLTAVDPEFDVVDLPFDAYVTKPVGRTDVRAVVEEMVARSAYDDDFRRFLALVSKKTTLEGEKDSAELATSEAYKRVERRVAERREELGLDTDDIEGIFAGTVPDIDPDVVQRQSATE